jgi:uncharacterized BrkB/YihY/UPF0761 family membrane protein
MHPVEHAIVGGLVSALGVASLWILTSLSPIVLVALFGYGLLVSVFVDLDHFPLARLEVGHWGHFRTAIRNLPGVLSGRTRLFEPAIADRLRNRRLVTHVIVGAILAGAGWAIRPAIAGFTILVVGTHVCCDLLRDRELL